MHLKQTFLFEKLLAIVLQHGYTARLKKVESFDFK